MNEKNDLIPRGPEPSPSRSSISTHGIGNRKTIAFALSMCLFAISAVCGYVSYRSTDVSGISPMELMETDDNLSAGPKDVHFKFGVTTKTKYNFRCTYNGEKIACNDSSVAVQPSSRRSVGEGGNGKGKGHLKNNQKKEKEPVYKGCFLDRDSRVLPMVNDTFPGTGLTVEKCRKYCGLYQRKYAGVQFRVQCWCGNEYLKSELQAEADCDMQCPGNTTERCGGTWRQNIYESIKDTYSEKLVYPVAKYVRLFRVDKRPEYINILELEVYDRNGRQIPKSDITPRLSPQYQNNAATYGPQFLVDGIYDRWDQRRGGLAVTENNKDAYMELELKNPAQVGKIVLFNRLDCCLERLVGTSVQVQNAAREQLYQANVTTVQRQYVFRVLN